MKQIQEIFNGVEPVMRRVLEHRLVVLLQGLDPADVSHAYKIRALIDTIADMKHDKKLQDRAISN